jgi:hypothetical protein
MTDQVTTKDPSQSNPLHQVFNSVSGFIADRLVRSRRSNLLQKRKRRRLRRKHLQLQSLRKNSDKTAQENKDRESAYREKREEGWSRLQSWTQEEKPKILGVSLAPVDEVVEKLSDPVMKTKRKIEEQPTNSYLGQRVEVNYSKGTGVLAAGGITSASASYMGGIIRNFTQKYNEKGKISDKTASTIDNAVGLASNATQVAFAISPGDAFFAICNIAGRITDEVTSYTSGKLEDAANYMMDWSNDFNPYENQDINASFDQITFEALSTSAMALKGASILSEKVNEYALPGILLAGAGILGVESSMRLLEAAQTLSVMDGVSSSLMMYAGAKGGVSAYSKFESNRQQVTTPVDDEEANHDHQTVKDNIADIEDNRNDGVPKSNSPGSQPKHVLK